MRPLFHAGRSARMAGRFCVCMTDPPIRHALPQRQPDVDYATLSQDVASDLSPKCPLKTLEASQRQHGRACLDGPYLPFVGRESAAEQLLHSGHWSTIMRFRTLMMEPQIKQVLASCSSTSYSEKPSSQIDVPTFASKVRISSIRLGCCMALCFMVLLQAKYRKRLI